MAENNIDTEQLRIFAKNLNYYISQSGKQQKEIAEALKFAPTTFNTWCMGKVMPKMGRIQAIADYFGILKSDLLEDKKKPNGKPLLSSQDEELLRDFHSLDPQGQETVRYILDNEKKRCKKACELDSKIKELETALSEKPIPKRIFAYYGKIAAAGTSYGFDDILSGTIEAPAADENRNADYTIGISGDSMEPTFYDGDIVYVKRATHLDMGDIGIFQKDNGIYIKEVGHGELISHNKKYSPMRSDEGFQCMGKVIGKVEEYKKLS